MRHDLPPPNWLRAFEASARHGSFAAAAEELNLTSAAISHQIRSLEVWLGEPLFERLARGVRLTDMGKAYLPPVRNAFEELSTLTVGLFGVRGGTTLSLRVPVSFAVLWLAPRLARFRQEHPSIRLRLFSAIWADALPADKIDVDIRFGHGKWPGYEASLILDDSSVVIRHPSDKLRDPAGVPADRLIHIMGLEEDWSRFYRTLGLAMPSGHANMNADTSLVAIELVAAGMGRALVLRCFARSAAEEGRVRIVPDQELVQEQYHYLLTRDSSERPRPEALIFRDWLAREAASERQIVRRKGK